LETNFCCRLFGRFGIVDNNSNEVNNTERSNKNNNEYSRFYLLHFGFLCNVVALLLTSYACLSISLEYFVVSKSAFQEVTVTETQFNCRTQLEKTDVDVITNTMYFGLSGLGLANQQVVVGYNELCDLDQLASYASYTVSSLDRLVLQDSCSNCGDYFSNNGIISLLISVATFFPTFFLDQNRMYSGYDVNCVKNFGCLVGLVTILLNINVILSYVFACVRLGRAFQDTDFQFDSNGNSFDSLLDDCNDYYYQVRYEWKWSWGIILLGVGTALKFLSILCNVCIATPTITRDRKEQDMYETIIVVSS